MKLYDTLSGESRPFTPVNAPNVNMYVCGVTPYAATHVGHALSYVVFDVLRRYLEFRGYQVRHVQNFTDVDDKLIQKADEQNAPVDELAGRHIEEFFRSMDALNVQRAHVYPRATKEIGPIIATIATLVDKDFAYPVDGDVFFRVTRSKGYGKLSGRTLDGMIAGARVEVDQRKEHPMDFTLWKASQPGEPAWDSPWGPGRPGWHIECTSMATTYLGEGLDIHGGGQDLIFPHHENEIAQSEAASGSEPFSRYWVHNGLLRLGEDKMSKSLGNLVPVEEALAKYSPDGLRLYFLSSHYRSPFQFSDEGCAAMERSVQRLGQALGRDSSGDGQELDPEPYQQRFLEAMDDDLNTPRSLAALFDLAREINRAGDEDRNIGQAQDCLRRLGGVLGLTFRGQQPGQEDDLLPAEPFVRLLLDVRAQLRRAKQYELADLIRQGLDDQGVSLEDSPDGTHWQFRRRP